MKNLKKSFMGCAMLALPIVMLACATVPPQVPVQVENAVFAKPGDTVHLFYGGSKLAKEEFCVDALVPVYRYEGRHSTIGSTGVKRDEVGKIKVTKELGEYYVEGVVVEGSIKNGDVAVQSQSGCLVNIPQSGMK